MDEFICRVCGFEYDTPTWEEGTGSGDICLCCGVVFGYEDSVRKAVTNYRKEWLTLKKGKWNSSYISSPKGWNLCDQLKKIEAIWRDEYTELMIEKICFC